MGFNTAVLIYNDALHVIHEHPKEFVDNLFHQISRGDEDEIGTHNHANVARVMESAHADVSRLYFSQGNLLTDLDQGRLEELDELHFGILQERVAQAGRMLSRAKAEVTAEAARRKEKGPSAPKVRHL
jgi:hypothetical protein